IHSPFAASALAMVSPAWAAMRRPSKVKPICALRSMRLPQPLPSLFIMLSSWIRLRFVCVRSLQIGTQDFVGDQIAFGDEHGAGRRMTPPFTQDTHRIRRMEKTGDQVFIRRLGRIMDGTEPLEFRD